jgi:integrase
MERLPYNTASAHLRAIQAFYIYAKSRDLNIDDAILACHFESILSLLDGYAIWLQSGRQADNLVARIGKAETAPFPQIDIQSEQRPVRDGKPMKLPYRYLFISDRGLPLSIRALSNVLDRLFLTIELADPGLLPTLSVHDFSHTFADRFLAYLVEKAWVSPRAGH